jgi:hypothetical protein
MYIYTCVYIYLAYMHTQLVTFFVLYINICIYASHMNIWPPGAYIYVYIYAYIYAYIHTFI